MKDSKIRHDGNQVISSGPSKLCKNLWTQIESDGLLLGIKSQKLMIPCQLVLRRRENLILNVPVFTASLVIGHKENSNCVGHFKQYLTFRLSKCLEWLAAKCFTFDCQIWPAKKIYKYS